MNKQIEKRYFTGPIEVRAVDGEPLKLRGYAAKFNTASQDLGGFIEKIQPGAFASSLTGDIRALVEHDPASIIGRSTNGTLRLVEDNIGLAVEITPPDTQLGRDTVANVQSGLLSQMSFGFFTKRDSWDKNSNPKVRTLEDVDLFDVSIVAYPAYLDTSVAMRSMSEQRDEVPPLICPECNSSVVPFACPGCRGQFCPTCRCSMQRSMPANYEAWQRVLSQTSEAFKQI